MTLDELKAESAAAAQAVRRLEATLSKLGAAKSPDAPAAACLLEAAIVRERSLRQQVRNHPDHTYDGL